MINDFFSVIKMLSEHALAISKQDKLTDELITSLNKSLAAMKIANDKLKTDLERETIKTATLESMMSTLQCKYFVI